MMKMRIPVLMTFILSALNMALNAQSDPVALCENQIGLSLPWNEFAYLNVEEVDAGSYDAEGIVSMTIDAWTFNCFDVGLNVVTLTVIDTDGNIATCQTDVYVIDNELPIAVCEDVTVQLNEEGTASIEPWVIAGNSYDDCSPVVDFWADQLVFTEEDLGENEVSITIVTLSEQQENCISIVTVEPFSIPSPYDLDGDGIVGTGDLSMMLGYFGSTNANGDLNEDGIVNFGDIILVLSAFE